MRKLTALLIGAALMMAAGSAWALPANPGNGYSWINAPFWTNTDLSTAVSGNSRFTLNAENFGTNQDSSFGLFYVNDINSPSDPTRFQIFSKAANAGKTKTITFWNDHGQYKITDSATPNAANTAWTAFSKIFGFYFGYDRNTKKTPDVTNYYYTAPSLDTDKDSQLNVFTSANRTKQINIFLDTNLNNIAYNMGISGNDFTPVPESGTMVLLGAGLLGLAVYGKRRMNKEA